MSSVSQFWNRSHPVAHGAQPAVESIGARLRSCLEYLWIGVTFLLFIVLGPFAAIAVVPAVFSLAANQGEGPEPERQAAAGQEF